MNGPPKARGTPVALVLAAVAAAVAVRGCAPGTGAPAGAPAPTAVEREAVLAPVQRLFDAIGAADGALAREVMAPGAHVAMLGEGGRALGVEGLAAMVAGAPEPWVERIWDPVVEVQGDVASVWAPYDFYRGGTFSHCGIDAFQLERRDGTWRIVSLVWVREQPPTCALHPQGPPR